MRIGKESSSDLFKVAGQWWLIWGGRFTEHVSNMLRCFAIMLICTNWKLMPIAFCLYPRLWVCSSLSMVLYSTLFLRGPLALPWLYEVFLCWKKWTMGPQVALYFQQAKNELYILTALLKLLLAHMSCYCAQIPTIYFCTSREHGWDMIASGWIMLLPIVLVSSSCIKEALLQMLLGETLHCVHMMTHCKEERWGTKSIWMWCRKYECMCATYDVW